MKTHLNRIESACQRACDQYSDRIEGAHCTLVSFAPKRTALLIFEFIFRHLVQRWCKVWMWCGDNVINAHLCFSKKPPKFFTLNFIQQLNHSPRPSAGSCTAVEKRAWTTLCHTREYMKTKMRIYTKNDIYLCDFLFPKMLLRKSLQYCAESSSVRSQVDKTVFFSSLFCVVFVATFCAFDGLLPAVRPYLCRTRSAHLILFFFLFNLLFVFFVGTFIGGIHASEEFYLLSNMFCANYPAESTLNRCFLLQQDRNRKSVINWFQGNIGNEWIKEKINKIKKCVRYTVVRIKKQDWQKIRLIIFAYLFSLRQ